MRPRIRRSCPRPITLEAILILRLPAIHAVRILSRYRNHLRGSLILRNLDLGGRSPGTQPIRERPRDSFFEHHSRASYNSVIPSSLVKKRFGVPRSISTKSPRANPAQWFLSGDFDCEQRLVPWVRQALTFMLEGESAGLKGYLTAQLIHVA